MTNQSPSSMPSREAVIAICARGVVPESKWHNRDSALAQRQLGEACALLQAGCEFWVADRPLSTDKTLWLDITYKGFDWFEEHQMQTDTFYLPTAERLDEVAGNDWY